MSRTRHCPDPISARRNRRRRCVPSSNVGRSAGSGMRDRTTRAREPSPCFRVLCPQPGVQDVAEGIAR
ncbi:MAG: hypothetical protein OEW93_05230 [Candidatus Bathyarchaeota archaeon]|nr:hypothetical protein [Candidatus Bathyarchaeota archaeon]